MGFFVHGKIRPEEKNPVNRLVIWLYMPFIRFALRYKFAGMAIAFGLLAVTFVPWSKLGSEFMPPLREGDILYMPTTLPGLSVTEARRSLQIQDQLGGAVPGSANRAGQNRAVSTTPTDPAPLDHGRNAHRITARRRLAQTIDRQRLSETTRRAACWKNCKARGSSPKPGQGLDREKIAQQAEGMSRAELTTATRMELVTALNRGLDRLRRDLKEHREQSTARGEKFGSRFDEQILEDQWAADILRKQMAEIRTGLPEQIIERLPQTPGRDHHLARRDSRSAKSRSHRASSQAMERTH